MTVAYDNESTLGVGTGDRNWNHAGGADARAALVIIYDGVTTDQVVGVTYGGTTMNEVSGSPLIQTGGEGGSVHAFFLDNCGTGTKNVAIDRNDATNYGAVCYTVTGTQIFVHDTSTSTSTSDATPDALLTITRPSFVAGGIYSGLNSVTTTNPAPISGVVATGAADFGTDGGQGARGDSIKTSDFTFGWTQTADDATLLVIALADRQIDVTSDDSLTSISESPSGLQTLARSIAQTLGSITDAVVGSKIFERTVDQALGSVSDGVSSLKALARSSGDSLADGISEEAARVVSTVRTVAQSLGSISDAVDRLASIALTTADALATLTEEVIGDFISGGPHNYEATTADTITSVTDVAARMGTFIRRESRPGD